MKKTPLILATVLSLATVSAFAAPQYRHHQPQHHRADRVTVIQHYHHTQPAPHHRIGQRYARPAPHYYRPAPRHYAYRPMPPRAVPHTQYVPVRPVPMRRPTANFSLSVNL